VAIPEAAFEIFLHPGEFWFGDSETRIRTLLGSCVSITVWHPWARIGGMCHYMLPRRARRGECATLDGRYADEAVELFLHEIYSAGTVPGDYQVKMFGGGRQFTGGATAAIDVPERNLQVGLDLLARHGLSPMAMHLGGSGHRQVVLDVWSGDVWVNHVDRTAPEVASWAR